MREREREREGEGRERGCRACVSYLGEPQEHKKHACTTKMYAINQVPDFSLSTYVYLQCRRARGDELNSWVHLQWATWLSRM